MCTVRGIENISLDIFRHVLCHTVTADNRQYYDLHAHSQMKELDCGDAKVIQS